MKKVEIIIAIVIVAGLLMKYFHIAGASVVLILSIIILSIMYYAMSFAYFNGRSIKSVMKSQSGKRLKPFSTIFAFIHGWGLSILLIGILFYIQIWPGFNIMFLTGFIVTGIGAIAFMVTKKDKIFQTILRTGLIGGLGLFLYLYPVRNYIDFVLSDNPEYATLLKKVYANPDNVIYRKELVDFRKKMIEEKK